MRRLFLVLLLTLAAAATLAWLVRMDSGYVLLQFHGTQLETSLWFALAALLLAWLLSYYAVRVLLIGGNALARVLGREPRAPARKRRGSGARGAQAFGEGRWTQAARLLASGARAADAPLLNYLAAAQAAERAGDTTLAKGFITLAAGVPGGESSARIARAGLQARAGEHAAALATLDAGAGQAEPAAIDLLLDLLPVLGEWARLGELLPEARKLELRKPAEIDALEERCFASLLLRAGTQPAALREAWRALPAPARQNGALVARQAESLSRAGAGDEALELLENALARGAEPVLLTALGRIRAGDGARQLARAEKLLARQPRNAELLLALGRIAAGSQLWGKAREYLEASISQDPQAAACAELARLCDRLGDNERARQLREQAVASALGEGKASV